MATGAGATTCMRAGLFRTTPELRNCEGTPPTHPSKLKDAYTQAREHPAQPTIITHNLLSPFSHSDIYFRCPFAPFATNATLISRTASPHPSATPRTRSPRNFRMNPSL